MPSLGTSETPDGGACQNSLLDKFIQLVLAVIIAAFIFLLGLVLIGASSQIYTLLNPTQTQSNSILSAVQSFASWFITLVIAVIGYLLLFIAVGLVLVYVCVFLIQVIMDAARKDKAKEPKAP